MGMNDEPQDVVEALLAIADSINNLARAVRDLGNGNASTDFGAIEYLGMTMQKGFEEVANSILAHGDEQ